MVKNVHLHIYEYFFIKINFKYFVDNYISNKNNLTTKENKNINNLLTLVVKD